MESDGESVDGSGSEADSAESTRLASEDEPPEENSDDQTFLDLGGRHSYRWDFFLVAPRQQKTRPVASSNSKSEAPRGNSNKTNAPPPPLSLTARQPQESASE